MNGTLQPLDGHGDSFPLVKSRIVIGRRPDCDIHIPAGNVSGRHCELRFHKGAWFVVDLKSRNGVKVNGERIVEPTPLAPGDEIAVARKHLFSIAFEPTPEGRKLVAEHRGKKETQDDDVFSQGLLERAGLKKKNLADFDDEEFDLDRPYSIDDE